jgi:general secretion pathway protein H
VSIPSALQRSGRPSVRGFTLIEILIVVFIIGLMAGLISLSLGKDKTEDNLRKEAQALIQAIDFVGEYAALNGEVLALFAKQQESDDSLEKYWCYNWQRYRDNQWVNLPEDSLGEHCMPANVQWEMVIEGHPYRYDPDLEIQPPVLVFSPSGEATPVEMAIFQQGTDAEAQHIEIDMMGSSDWREQEDAKLRDEKSGDGAR